MTATLTNLSAHPAVRLYNADALETLRALPDASVDVCITDPPYGLADHTPKKITDTLARWLGGETDYVPAGRGFMGQPWDRFVPPPALWAEVLRVLKPGGFLVSFAGARTYDLMGLSVRLAGFRLRDGLAWVRADAFAKTAHALKPGFEPIVFAQKPLDGTVQENIDTWGTGGLNVEASRTPFVSEADEAESKGKNQHGVYGTQHGGNAVYGDYSGGGTREDYNPPGRWPSNLLLAEESAAELDAANRVSKSRRGAPRAGAAGEGWGMTATGAEYDDEGGPSRFFPKVFYAGRAPAKERPVAPDGTKHTTVKPLSIMDWLVRLLMPAGGVVVDPFAGSGTTVESVLRAGGQVIAIESHAPYIPLITQRIVRTSGNTAHNSR